MTKKAKLEFVQAGETVPVFTCLVYVRHEGSEVVGRVANLGGIEARAASERDLLSKIIPEFKRTCAQWILSPPP